MKKFLLTTIIGGLISQASFAISVDSLVRFSQRLFSFDNLITYQTSHFNSSIDQVGKFLVEDKLKTSVNGFKSYRKLALQGYLDNPQIAGSSFITGMAILVHRSEEVAKLLGGRTSSAYSRINETKEDLVSLFGEFIKKKGLTEEGLSALLISTKIGFEGSKSFYAPSVSLLKKVVRENPEFLDSHVFRTWEEEVGQLPNIF